ncbi:MAG: non-ribosomal peptide synthetase, partial [Chloroflexi bacterium]
MAASYGALVRGAPPPLAPLPLRYADFARWQRERISGETLDHLLARWRARLDGAASELTLPTDRPRPRVQEFRAGKHRFALTPNLTEGVRALARRLGVTPFMTLLAAYAAVLARWSGQSDLVLGTPVANRTRPELEDLIGRFVNTLALRVDLSGDPTFGQLLGRVREVTLDAYEHQELPFEKLVAELRPARDP